MENHWLGSNKSKLDEIRHHLTELEYQQSVAEVPLREIVFLFNGAEAEIVKLQNELDLKTKQLKDKETTPVATS